MLTARALITAVLALLLVAVPAAAAPQFPPTPAPEFVPGPSTVNQGGLRAAVTPGGESIAVWGDSSGRVYAARRDAGGAWTYERTLFDGGSAYEIEIAADAAGAVTVAFIGDFVTRYAVRSAGGSWGATQTQTGGAAADDLALAVGRDGRAVLAWRISTGEIAGTYRTPGAAAFETTVETISATGGHREDVHAAVTTTGRAVVAWINQTDGDVDFAIRETTDGGFDPEATAYGVSPVARELSLAPDGLGNVHLAFQTTQSGPDQVEMWGKVLGSTSSSFGVSEPITALFGTTDVGAMAISGGANGSATVLWIRANGAATAHHRPPGGPWAGEGLSGGGTHFRGASLAQDPSGDLVALWIGESGGPPTVATRSAGTWSSPRELDTGMGWEASLAVGATGDALAVWIQNTASGREPRAAAGDSGAPPRLSLAAPASLVAGDQGAFALSATDFSGISSSSLAFGDGSTASSGSASHAFAAPGAYRVTGRAVDGRGNAASTSATVSVATAPVVAPPAPPAPGARSRTGRPDTNIDRIARRVRASRLRRFSGRASDELGLRSVEISLVRLRGGARFTASQAARRCDALRSDGRVRRTTVRRGRCAARAFLRASGTTRWTYRLMRRLPRGSYVLVARARAADGTTERGFSAADRNLVRFKVR